MEDQVSPYLRDDFYTPEATAKRRRFNLARDLLVAHVALRGLYIEGQSASDAVAVADQLLAALAKPQEGGE